MKTPALVVMAATLAGLLTAPALAFAFAPDDHATVARASEPLSASAAAAAASNAHLRFVVKHTGLDAPAILTLEGDGVTWAHGVVLEAGSNTLLDGPFPIGDYSITLQNVMTAGTNRVDLAACDGVTLAAMNTTFQTTRFALSIPADQCLTGQD